MRILCYSILAPKPPGPAIRDHHELELTGLHPRSVDCGDFGASRQDPRDYAEDYPIHLLPVFPRRPYPYSVFVGGVNRVIREANPEILWVQGEPSELGVAQVVRATRRVAPECRIVLNSFENVAQQWRSFPRVLRGWAERATLPRLDMVRAFNEGVREVLAGRGFPPERVRVVPLSVDRSRFHPSADDGLRARLSPGGKFLVGYVGRLVHEKGIDLLLRAAGTMTDRVALCLVGSGRAEGELRELAGGLTGLEVRWIPRVPPDEVAEYLSAFDAMVLPSRSIPTWREQFGRVLIEAMACGTPVIGSSCGAIAEVIGDAGLVFPEGDSAALAEALERLIDDEALRRELAERGFSRARERYDPEREIEAMLEMFREVLELPPRSGG